MSAREPPVDLAVMREMADACGWTLDEMARRYLQEARKMAAQLRDALDRGALAEAARVAHGWSGASGMAGAVGLGKLLKRLELTAAGGRAAETSALALQVGEALAEAERSLRNTLPLTPPPPPA